MNKQLFSLAMVLAAAMSAEGVLIFPGLEEPPPPPQERVEQIRREFLALNRPLDFTVKVKDGGWRGGDVSDLVLGGATARFAKAYSNVELVHALWPMLDDPKTDADAFMVLFGKIAPSRYGGHFPSYRSPQQPGDWAVRRKDDIRICKSKCLGVVGQGGNPFWKPHPILFQYDYEKFRTMSDQPTDRAEWIGNLRGWLRDPDVVTNNPLEVYKIAVALRDLKAAEAAPEIAELLFYDWQQGGNYRDSNKVERMEIGPPAECMMLSVLPAVAGTNAIPFALGRYLRTSAEDRMEKPGCGYAPALMIRFFIGLPKVGNRGRYTQADAIGAIQAYKASRKDLAPDQKAILDDLIATIKSGRYQFGSGFVYNNWFGNLPFTYQVLSNGDVVGGYRIGESFYSFWSRGLLGKVDAAWLAAHPDQAKMVENDMQGVSLDSSREQEYQAFRDKTLLLFAGHLVTNAPQIKPRPIKRWYEPSY